MRTAPNHKSMKELLLKGLKKSNAPWRLTEDQKTEIFDLYADNEKIQDIARKYFVSRRNVMDLLRRHGIPKRKRTNTIHNQKLTAEMKAEIIQRGMERQHRKIISKEITQKYKVEITPGHVSGILAVARSEGIAVPYYVPNYARAAPRKVSASI